MKGYWVVAVRDVIKSDTWEVRLVTRYYIDGARDNRLYKILPHRHLADYDMSVCIDADVLISKDIGIIVEEHLKENMFTINGVPSDLLGKEDPKVIESLLEEFKACEGDPQSNDQNALALSLARYSCIKEGIKLMEDEMRALIDQLFACSQPNFAPDGRPVFVSISLDQINDLFQK